MIDYEHADYLSARYHAEQRACNASSEAYNLALMKGCMKNRECDKCFRAVDNVCNYTGMNIDYARRVLKI
jgi:hypothetical protein